MNDLRTRYAEHGYVRLERAFPPELAATMADAVWAQLQRTHGISQADRSTWTVVEPRGLGALRKRGAFDALATAAVVAAISELLGHERWPPPFSWGDPLVTFPSQGRWDVPAGGWHIDFPARSALLLKWLAYLAPVTAGGGGTVVLAGSHRLVKRFVQAHPSDPGRSATVCDAIFATHPWLRDVRRTSPAEDRITRLMHRGAMIDGVDVRVVELTGQPGDVVFLHPHLFHAPAPNRSPHPRLMITGGIAGGADQSVTKPSAQ
jgi:ectoine hydroxylase-related dioxygenase (phytanoyl-CoA dioxygenase family)